MYCILLSILFLASVCLIFVLMVLLFLFLFVWFLFGLVFDTFFGGFFVSGLILYDFLPNSLKNMCI